MTAPAPYPIPRDAITPCAENPDRFFPDKTASPQHMDAIKAVCLPCPFREGCASWAVTRGEQGVWGATDDAERKAFRRKHGITVVRPKLNTGVPHGPTKDNLVPHGTPIGVESHRKRYEPLCDACFGFDVERKNGRGVAS